MILLCGYYVHKRTAQTVMPRGQSLQENKYRKLVPIPHTYGKILLQVIAISSACMYTFIASTLDTDHFETRSAQ